MAEPIRGEPPRPFDLVAFAELVERQDGVVSRPQLREVGARDHDIARLLRRRDLTRVYDGVYVNHTGSLSWGQRAWAAVLDAWPAALSHSSALPNPPDAPIEIAVGLGRHVSAHPGVRVHRMAELDRRVLWVRSPPSVRVEHAAIDVAVRKQGIDQKFKVFADVCQSRRTAASAIAAALGGRRRVRGRAELVELLADLDSGACSVLERGYLRLEQLHGLPTAERQRPDRNRGRRHYADAPYPALGVRVELDGRAFHDSATSRDADAERDLDSWVEHDELTVRLTYGQVFGRGCSTVRKVAALLERRGWPGPFVPCPECP